MTAFLMQQSRRNLNIRSHKSTSILLFHIEKETLVTISGSIDNMLSLLFSSQQLLNSILYPVRSHTRVANAAELKYR